MKTEPIYLTDPYQKVCNAKIIESFDEGEGAFSVILDQTVFYPMGGGQPTDQGFLIFSNGQKGEVFQVILKDGEIRHYIKSENIPTPDEEVICEIDWERRYYNMRVHSAGHIIDFAMHQLGYSPKTISPFKGDHGKKPFVQYQGELSVGLSKLKADLEAKVEELIKNNIQFSWEFKTFDELKEKALYLQPNLPQNKPLRALTLESVGTVADGGTIVSKTSEVVDIDILEIQVKDGFTTVFYRVDKNIEGKERQQTTDNRQESMKSTVESLEYTKSQTGSQLKENLKAVKDSSLRSTFVQNDKDNNPSSTITNASGNFDIAEMLSSVHEEITTHTSEEQLTELWRKYLGKDGKVKNLFAKISDLVGEEKKKFGQDINSARNEIDNLINSAKLKLKESKSSKYLETPQGKLSKDRKKVGHLHPVTETINELNRILGRLGYSVYDGPELETYEYNFKRCNVPEDHPALDLQDSIYVREPDILLRTQTSSMEARALVELKPPFKVVMPGRTFRNEKVNKSNHFVFHQYQLVCVQEKVSMSELISTIEYLFKSFLGEDVETRYRNKYYPEVEPGVGPDMRCFNCKGDGCVICKHRGWMEMGGAGIIHPNIMRMAGLDTEKWQGFAFGLGLDRWAMAKYDIKDIRTLLGGNLAYKAYAR